MPELGPDVARRARTAVAGNVPLGPAPNGYFLAVTGQIPFQYDWRQPPAGSVIPFHGDPNGALNAAKGQLATDVDEPGLWQNTDGLDTWERVNGAGAVTDSLYGDSGVSIPAGGTATAVGWVFGDGDVVLDVSTPTLPTAVAAGMYAFTADVNTASTLTGGFAVELTVRPAGGATQRPARLDPFVAPGEVTLPLVAFMDVGDDVELRIANHDGSSAGSFNINITVTTVT